MDYILEWNGLYIGMDYFVWMIQVNNVDGISWKGLYGSLRSPRPRWRTDHLRIKMNILTIL